MPLVSHLIAFASQRFPKLSSRVLASSGHTVDLDSFGSEAFGVWTKHTADRQDRAWRPIVAAAKAGHPRKDVAALFDAIDSLAGQARTLLEVGCGGGYNSEILAHRFPGLAVSGVDISAAMIDIARKHYPERTFSVGNAYALDFGDSSIDIVVDGVAMLHMEEWTTAISEYARVSSGYVVLHGLTLTDSPTVTFAKYAYGQPSIELVFNRAELLGACEANGLVLRSTHVGLDYDLADYIGVKSVSETWVLEG